MKILTAAQMREIDRRTVESCGVPSLLLMENAGVAVVEFLERKFPDLAKERITILCGPGNNGGDGFVVARQLLQRGVKPRTVLFGDPERLQGDAAACGAGLYLHKDAVGQTKVAAAPSGFFAPEFQTCLVRCPPGGYCPQSEYHADNDKCKFPARVEPPTRPAELGGGEPARESSRRRRGHKLDRRSVSTL